MRAFFLISLFCLVPFVATAQTKQELKQSGEIVLEEDESKTDSYASIQDKAIAFVKGVHSTILTAGSTGAASRIAAPSDDVINFLNSAYLHCTIASGTCPSILDALLEADIINSQLDKQASCPTMKQFWRLWLKNDMEQRQKYMVLTAFLTDTENFRIKERPKYIKCEPTVQSTIAGNAQDATFFKSRYSADANTTASVLKASQVLDEIKKLIPNIFVKVGSR